MNILSLDSAAKNIGVQIFREARKATYERGKPGRERAIAETMANRFHSEILKAIDDEFRFQSAKQV